MSLFPRKLNEGALEARIALYRKRVEEGIAPKLHTFLIDYCNNVLKEKENGKT